MESLYSRQTARVRYKNAPLLEERDQFLSHRLSLGYRPEKVLATSALLIGISEFLQLTSIRTVTPEELENAAERWCRDQNVHRSTLAGASSKGRFVRCAKQWLAFHAMPVQYPVAVAQFSDLLNGYVHQLGKANYANSTIKGWKSCAKTFLTWLSHRHSTFAAVSLQDVDDYISDCSAQGRTNGALKTTCQGLRSLLRYASSNGLSKPSLAEGIISPSTPLYNQTNKVPAWSEIREVLDHAAEMNSRAGLRLHAVLCLAAVYALRGEEIASLELEDFDWRKETLTIRRAKGGRIQQYPLQYEVGDAVIRYLKSRPVSRSRHVFLTTHAPFRNMSANNLCQLIGNNLKATTLMSGRATAHALRHACATKLLQQGSSLQYISHFLGHRDSKSVSIYARFDTKTLKEIAAFSLKGL